MPVHHSKRRKYQREYHRKYGKTARRRAYLSAKQREYRGRKSPEYAAELLDQIGLQSGIRFCVGGLLQGK